MSGDLPATPFAAWLRETLATLRQDEPADVPCGRCNACCRTFHQIHLRPGERRARKRLPKEYLSVARGLPPGYLLLGYTQAGACPVLIDGRCTVYEDRPLVCRTYDCRLYAATGVRPDRAEIAAQVRRWRFGYPAAEDRELQLAVLSAVHFIGEHPRSRCTRSSSPGPLSASVTGPCRSGTGSSRSPTPTRNCSATVDAPWAARIPCGQSPAPAGKSRPKEA
jgi:Fe-S-cluster containining protein